MHLTDDDQKAIARATGWRVRELDESYLSPYRFADQDIWRGPDVDVADAYAALLAWKTNPKRDHEHARFVIREGTLTTVELFADAELLLSVTGADLCEAACKALIAAGRGES